MKQALYTIGENTRIAKDVYKMRLLGDSSACSQPGQFLNIQLPEKYLRRPISVCDWDSEGITIIYKILGNGTEMMSGFAAGEQLDVLTGLGNGYDMSKSGDRPLLIGGGVGVPPLYGLCRRLVEQGKQPTVILGFNTADEIFYADEFRALGVEVRIATVDGSVGIKGFVTDAMVGLDYTYFYTCGPLPMFKAIEKTVTTSGQYSLEERMGCGFGACMGCSIKTRSGNKRVCKEGPVFEREDIIW
ncbi:MAG: dihydroorotate dehydrogenase electron transfer subunit [Firmicutes bacterium]|nr:dihydroorotate dehydrogenase electron transfer subunit [Bacillota bacterium]